MVKKPMNQADLVNKMAKDARVSKVAAKAAWSPLPTPVARK